MSKETFLIYLQSLLTMADTPEKQDAACKSLAALVELAMNTDKVDRGVLLMMRCAEYVFSDLCDCREMYIGRPGDHFENRKKRTRLMMRLRSFC